MLLFDENLSHHLPGLLADVYPGSVHVRHLGMTGAADPAVWRHAAANGLAIVSRDRDMQALSLRHGHPPKVIWVYVGNVSTARTEALLRSRYPRVAAFLADPDDPLLILN